MKIAKTPKLEHLYDQIQKEQPALETVERRIYLAMIAIGYRVMCKYAGHGVAHDEWFCGNALYVDGCNKVRAYIGRNEDDVTRRIRSAVDQENAS
jgi:hypothetical protein